MKLNIKLDEGARLPERGTPESAGLDLYATALDWDVDHQVYTYHTGVHVEIPDGYVGLLFSRSSVYKKDLLQTNCVGVIDSDYRGEVMVKFCKRKNELQFNRYEVGEKIAQLVIIPCVLPSVNVVSELSQTYRGNGGYGSTGK